MNPQNKDKNWDNLFGHITTEGVAWYGIWTMYSLNKEVQNSFKAVRKLQANEDRTVITHTNKYSYCDKTESEKTWVLEKQICSQPDGVIHPASSSMRALSFGEGKNAWISKKLEVGQKFGIELFFQYQDWRTSVASIYGENGDLDKVTVIREHLSSFPDIPPQVEIQNLPGNWSGRKEYINSDLQISTSAENLEFVLKRTTGENKTISLPDGIVVNVPPKVSVGKEFEIVAGKLVTKHEYRRLIAQYDKSGSFAILISEVFKPQD